VVDEAEAVGATKGSALTDFIPTNAQIDNKIRNVIIMIWSFFIFFHPHVL
jgi:hypothetical protein